jgi:hypothetical protein
VEHQVLEQSIASFRYAARSDSIHAEYFLFILRLASVRHGSSGKSQRKAPGGQPIKRFDFSE